MAHNLVIINGLPGAGKSTLGAALTGVLSAALISKDRLKLGVAEAVPESSSLAAFGPIVMGAAWSIAAELPGTVILESWWLRSRDLEVFAQGLATVRAPAVEVWCHVPAATARSRFTARHRDPVFRDQHHAKHSWSEWEAGSAPMGITPVIKVDTTGAVDVVGLAATIRSELASCAHHP